MRHRGWGSTVTMVLQGDLEPQQKLSGLGSPETFQHTSHIPAANKCQPQIQPPSPMALSSVSWVWGAVPARVCAGAFFVL